MPPVPVSPKGYFVGQQRLKNAPMSNAQAAEGAVLFEPSIFISPFELIELPRGRPRPLFLFCYWRNSRSSEFSDGGHQLPGLVSNSLFRRYCKRRFGRVLVTHPSTVRARAAGRGPPANRYPMTPDHRYFMVNDRLWRMSDPSLPPFQLQR